MKPVEIKEMKQAAQTLQKMIDGHYFAHSERVQAEEIVESINAAIEETEE